MMGRLYNSITLIDQEDNERREEQDRRAELSPTAFPVYTECGTWVRKERRKMPERRLQNIDVCEDQLQEDEFIDLFKSFR